jgi:thiol:disulfide interchange protein DsbD
MNSLSEQLGSLLSAGASASAGQILLALAVAYLGGILASLTPCVYPMIPITVSVVGGIGHLDPHRKHNLRGVWLRGAAYVAGMTVIYSLLGVLAGVSGRVFGSFTNTPGWYFALGLIMTLALIWRRGQRLLRQSI